MSHYIYAYTMQTECTRPLPAVYFSMQSSNHILMIRPVSFSGNPQTAVNNHFQHSGNANESDATVLAQQEFDRLAELMQSRGIRVTICQDSAHPAKPDAVFPNNWVSFHTDYFVLYPMFAANRRTERRPDVIREVLGERMNMVKSIDLSPAENNGFFLEGTGSLVLDRVNKKAYAARSPRTSEALLQEWALLTGYSAVLFNASQDNLGERKAVYHTNVVMSIGEKFVVICSESIDLADRERVMTELGASGREIILISEEQMGSFAGNMLEVRNASGSAFLIMSTRAFQSLTREQVTALEAHAEILHAPLDCIETCGGGSARCMLAEIF